MRKERVLPGASPPSVREQTRRNLGRHFCFLRCKVLVTCKSTLDTSLYCKEERSTSWRLSPHGSTKPRERSRGFPLVPDVRFQLFTDDRNGSQFNCPSRS